MRDPIIFSAGFSAGFSAISSAIFPTAASATLASSVFAPTAAASSGSSTSPQHQALFSAPSMPSASGMVVNLSEASKLQALQARLNGRFSSWTVRFFCLALMQPGISLAQTPVTANATAPAASVVIPARAERMDHMAHMERTQPMETSTAPSTTESAESADATPGSATSSPPAIAPPVDAPRPPARRTRLTHEERQQLRHDIKRAGQELYPPARSSKKMTSKAAKNIRSKQP